MICWTWREVRLPRHCECIRAAFFQVGLACVRQGTSSPQHAHAHTHTQTHALQSLRHNDFAGRTHCPQWMIHSLVTVLLVVASVISVYAGWVVTFDGHDGPPEASDAPYADDACAQAVVPPAVLLERMVTQEKIVTLACDITCSGAVVALSGALGSLMRLRQNAADCEIDRCVAWSGTCLSSVRP